jgi:transcription antitermination factor NusG
MRSLQEPNWFALKVRPNHEQTAHRCLTERGFESYLPVYRVRRRWSDRIKEMESVLFPSYVFCRFGESDRLCVLSAPGVRSIVGTRNNPMPVDESQLQAVRAIVSSGQPVALWPYVRAGQRVAIMRGPLASLRGVVVRANNSWRVVVSVDALTCSICVEVDFDSIVPESIPAARHEAAQPNGCLSYY